VLRLSLRAAAWLPVTAALWWIAVEGRPGSWGVGLPVALAAALAAAAIPPAGRSIRLLPLLRFLAYFAYQSVKGGVDVARRALSPSLPLAPGFAELSTDLPAGAPRVLFADTVSLLPGTLTVDVDGPRVLVHGLDAGEALHADARALEARVAALFRPVEEERS